MSHRLKLTGKIFGHLKVLGPAGIKSKGTAWHVRCDCGRTAIVVGSRLKSGEIRGCGCRRGRITHGYGKHPLYHTWQDMMARCYNPGATGFENYGGRGIRVCQRWHTIAYFIADMHPRPSRQHTLDRINNHGHYSPSNCRWALPSVQRRNSRTRVHLLTFQGRTQCLTDWAHEVGLSPQTVEARLRYNWPIEKALTLALHARYWIRGTAPSRRLFPRC